MTSTPKAIALLSGGLDSCVAVACARQDGIQVTHALSVHYGQRHHVELHAAAAIAEHYGLHQKEIDLWQLGDLLGNTSALLTTEQLPQDRSTATMAQAVPRTYVPGRNTIMLALAQSLAEAYGLDHIVCGFNAVDFSGYPDCRPIFVEAWNHLAKYATNRGYKNNAITLLAPLVNWGKAHVVQEGLDLGAPLHLTWSCYQGGERPCGRCDSCRIRAEAFKTIGKDDPALCQSTGR